jgi:hypothetical protein
MSFYEITSTFIPVNEGLFSCFLSFKLLKKLAVFCKEICYEHCAVRDHPNLYVSVFKISNNAAEARNFEVPVTLDTLHLGF